MRSTLPTAPGGSAWSQMWSHSPGFAGVRQDPSVTVSPGRGRWRTPVNAGQHCWKACWGQPLASSNLASSATSDQAIHQVGHAFGLDLQGCVVSFVVSFILRISVQNVPKVQAQASECYQSVSPCPQNIRLSSGWHGGWRAGPIGAFYCSCRAGTTCARWPGGAGSGITEWTWCSDKPDWPN